MESPLVWKAAITQPGAPRPRPGEGYFAKRLRTPLVLFETLSSSKFVRLLRSSGAGPAARRGRRCPETLHLIYFKHQQQSKSCTCFVAGAAMSHPQLRSLRAAPAVRARTPLLVSPQLRITYCIKLPRRGFTRIIPRLSAIHCFYFISLRLFRPL